jgi:hypothetical protein
MFLKKAKGGKGWRGDNTWKANVPIETTIGGNKVKLSVDAEPDAKKIQIQAGHGKDSTVDIKIDPSMPLET